MTTTMNHDEEIPREVTHLVFGTDGFTSEMPEEQILQLISIGALRWVKDTGGADWNVKVYESVASGRNWE